MSLSLAHAPAENRLLSALPPAEYQRLQAVMEEIPLRFAEILYEPGERLRHVYFPTRGIVSLLCTAEGRHAVETAMVGNEGMAGLSVVLGAGGSCDRALVQGPGTALRVGAEALRRHFTRGGTLERRLHRYTHARLTQVGQLAACNRFHRVEARLARWLLMTQDRLRADEFPMTQEFLSYMLGVRRPGITEAAGALQKRALIHCRRGTLRILDRDGLAAAACRCYRIIAHAYDDGLG